MWDTVIMVLIYVAIFLIIEVLVTVFKKLKFNGYLAMFLSCMGALLMFHSVPDRFYASIWKFIIIIVAYFCAREYAPRLFPKKKKES